ncbi:MAG: hypothetical protein ACE5IQ_09630 [Candidatus Methylomirabilales bacterium]
MGGIGKAWRSLGMAFLLACLLFSSGCALFLVGAAGGGGYMIRKGEEKDAPKKQESSAVSPQKSSSIQGVQVTLAFSSSGSVGEAFVLRRGDTSCES